LLGLAVVAVLAAWLRGPPEVLRDGAGTPVYVIDGDSLRIGARTVRLQGIDAVELHQLCQAADGAQWSCGLSARDALRALVGGGDLACSPRATDDYGRDVASCAVASAQDLSAELVAQGWAVSGDGRSNGDYLIEEARARSSHLGIWRGTFQRPADWRAANPRPAVSPDHPDRQSLMD
jgi:endonuclease YncB( thermonuclease family)